MYPVTSAYKDAVQAAIRDQDVRLVIQTASQTLELTAADIVEKSLKVTWSTVGGDRLCFGGCVIADMSVSIINRGGEYDGVQFNGAVLRPSVGIKTASGGYEWVPLGVFTADDLERTGKTPWRPFDAIQIQARDRLLLLDVPLSEVGVSYPITANNLLTLICQHCGIPRGTMSFENDGYQITAAPDGDPSCRDIVRGIAELAGCFARCDRDGYLVLEWYRDPGYITETEMDGGRFKSQQTLTSSAASLPTGTGDGQDTPLDFTDGSPLRVESIKGAGVLSGLNLTPYDPSTWEPWISNGALADSSGMTIESYYVFPMYNVNLSGKYGLLIDIVQNTVYGTVGIYLDGASIRQITGTGNYSDVLSVDGATSLGIGFTGMTDTGVFKFKNFRLFELPEGSQISSDFKTLTADELNAKYPFSGHSTRYYVENPVIKSTNADGSAVTEIAFLVTLRDAGDIMDSLDHVDNRWQLTQRVRADGSALDTPVVTDVTGQITGSLTAYAGGHIVLSSDTGVLPEIALTYQLAAEDDADGGNFSRWNDIDRDGGVFDPETPDATVNNANRYDFAIDDDPISISGVTFETDEAILLAGSRKYTIDITGNSVITHDIPAVLRGLLAKVKGFTYMPFSSSCRGDPAMDAGDLVEHVGVGGKTYRTIVTDYTYSYDGKSSMSAAGVSEIASGYKAPAQKQYAAVAAKIAQKQAQLNALDQAIKNASQLIAGMWGGHVVNGDTLDDEKYHGNIFICDNVGSDGAHPDVTQAVKVWRWNLGGLGYSSAGIDGPYQTAVTADGTFVGNLIVANMIRTGLLQSNNGASKINLDDGTFSFANGALVWDGTTFKAVNAEKLKSPGSDAYGIMGAFTDPDSGNILDGMGLYDRDGNLICALGGTSDSSFLQAYTRFVLALGNDLPIVLTETLTALGTGHSITNIWGNPVQIMSGSQHLYVNDSGVHCSNGHPSGTFVSGTHTLTIKDGIVTGLT